MFFLAKVRPTIRQQIDLRAEQPKRLWEAINICAKTEQSVPNCKPQKSSQKTEREQTGSGRNTRDSKPDNGGSRPDKRPRRSYQATGANAVPRAQLAPKEYERRRKEELCYKCGQAGHQARNCYSGAAQQTENGRPQ